MPKFVFIGGTTRTNHFSEDGSGIHDETKGVEMPDTTDAFGIKFKLDKPTDVSREMFADQAKFEHAVRKLTANPYFKPWATDAEYEMVEEPKPVELPQATRGPGRPRKDTGLAVET